MSKYQVPFNTGVYDVEIDENDMSLHDNRVDIELCKVYAKGFEKPFKLMSKEGEFFFTHPQIPLVPEESIAYNKPLERKLNVEDILGDRNYFHIQQAIFNLFKENEIDLYTVLSFKDIESIIFNNEEKYFLVNDRQNNLRTSKMKVKLDGEKYFFKYKNFTNITLVNSRKLSMDTFFFFENGENSILAWLENNRFRTKFYKVPKDKRVFKFRYYYKRQLENEPYHNVVLEQTIDQVQFDQLVIEDERFWKKLVEEMFEDFNENPEKFVGLEASSKRQKQNISLAKFYIENLPFHSLAKHNHKVPGSKEILIHFLDKLEKYLLKITI